MEKIQKSIAQMNMTSYINFIPQVRDHNPPKTLPESVVLKAVLIPPPRTAFQL